MAGKAASHRVDGKAHRLAARAQPLGQFRHRLLRLCHRHAVARNDDDAVGIVQRRRHTFGINRNLFAGDFHRRTCHGAEAAQNNADEAAVHRLAHDVAQDRTGRAHQRAGDDQQVIAKGEADGSRRPARIAVEHRHDHGHVGAADAHDQVIADEEGQQRHRNQRPGAGLVEVEHAQRDRPQCCGGVQQMPAGQLLGHAIHFARQLAKGHNRPGEGDGTDEDAQEDLDPQDRDFDGRFMGQDGGKALQRLPCRRIHAQNAAQFDIGVEADEDGGQTDKAVQRRHKLRHFRHLDAHGDDPAQNRADQQHQNDQPQMGHAGAKDGGPHGQRHAGNAVPDGALGAFLARQPAQRKDEKNCRSDVGGPDDTDAHEPILTTSGTWRASGVSPGSHRRC